MKYNILENSIVYLAIYIFFTNPNSQNSKYTITQSTPPNILTNCADRIKNAARTAHKINKTKNKMTSNFQPNFSTNLCSAIAVAFESPLLRTKLCVSCDLFIVFQHTHKLPRSSAIQPFHIHRRAT